jgi:hypothetical protein
VACSGVWDGGVRLLAGGSSACCVLGVCVPFFVVAAWLAAYLFMVRACRDDMTWADFFTVGLLPGP